jgi:hypothetical protein
LFVPNIDPNGLLKDGAFVEVEVEDEAEAAEDFELLRMGVFAPAALFGVLMILLLLLPLLLVVDVEGGTEGIIAEEYSVVALIRLPLCISAMLPAASAARGS